MVAIGPIILIIVIFLVVVGIILATRSRENIRSESGTEGMSVARHVWLYLITLIALGIFAAGVGQLLALFFDVTIRKPYLTQIGARNFNLQQLSLGLAMTVIGGPLWFFFWRAIQRRVKGNEEEIGAVTRKLFLNFILLVTALMAVIAASDFLKWLLAGLPAVELSSGGLATAIVAGIIWFYHWRVAEVEGQPSQLARTLRRWYIYILAGFGLVWLAVGLVQLFNSIVVALPVWGNSIVQTNFWNDTTQLSMAQIIFGGLTWYLHWFRMVREDYDSILRQVYFYVLTISGGAITALVALIILLYRIFVWMFGGTLSGASARIAAGPPLRFLGWAVPTIIVGLAIWSYHLQKAQEEAGSIEEKRQSAQRVYLYLMSFLGLGILATGLCIFLGMFLDFGTSLTSTAGWWRNQLAVSLSLLVVGTPLWLYYWNIILKRLQANGMDEWLVLSRRIYLYVIVGVSIVLLAADLVNIIYQLLRGILQGNLGTDFLHNSKWSLQTLIVAALLLWYHWQLLRADQRRGVEAAVVRKSVILLADDRSGELTTRLESKLGFKIHNLYQVGEKETALMALSDAEIDKLASEIASAVSNKVMLVVLEGKVTVLPYQEK